MNRSSCLTLYPCADDTACPAEQLQVVVAIREVASVEFFGAEVFDVAEAGEFASHLLRLEEELEGLARELDARGKRVVGELLEGWKRGAGLAVVHYDARACGRGGDERECGTEGCGCEV